MTHTVEDTTEGGNVLTVCMVLVTLGELVPDAVDCPACLSPVAQTLVGPSSGVSRTGRPQWRTERNLLSETIQGVRFAHTAVVASLEWFGRGEQGQFTANALDQAMLAYRFLREALITHGRLEDDSQGDNE